MNKKNIFLNFFGIYFIIIAIVAFYNAITEGNPSEILWLSYFAFLLTGIGVLSRNSFLIGSQLNIIFMPYLVWNVDFFYRLFASKSFFGVSDYFFTTRPITEQIVSIQHILLVPIALVAIYIIKFKRKDFWKWSLSQTGLIFVLTRLLSEKEQNINCAFNNCIHFKISIGAYPFAWILAVILMILAVNYALVRIKFLNE